VIGLFVPNANPSSPTWPAHGTHETPTPRIGRPAALAALNITVADRFRAVATLIVGTFGAVGGAVGTKLFDGTDATLVPITFVAVTVHV